MPISNKIMNEISKLDVKEEEKKLLLKILEMEDGGLRNYTAPYEKEIADFIAAKQGGE